MTVPQRHAWQLWSQSNLGHPFGDHLTDAQRRAVLEYLKTL